MFRFQGIWLPDGEAHFPKWMTKNGEIVDGRGTYQIKKWRACLPWIKQWRTAVDVGAHVGFWSIQMAKAFGRVEAFEPMLELRQCWARNVVGQEMDFTAGSVRLGYGHYVAEPGQCTLHAYALGSAPGRVRMNYNPADTGNTHVGGDGDIELRTLDSFGFLDVDFIKIDCEGYEAEVVKGARETIERCRPCIIVEQKQHIMQRTFGITGTPAVDLLKEMGAVVRKEIGGDYILTFD